MMSNLFNASAYVDKGGEMTPHHSCGGEICGNDGELLLCVDYAHHKDLFVSATCCCQSPHSNTNIRDNTHKYVDGRSYTERRNSSHTVCVNKNVYSLLYSFCILLCIVLSKCSAQSTVCDFKGSGLDINGNGIQPAYLSCTSGRVDWHYPRAALRIVLQFPGENREFRGCIKASPDIEGARLFVEGHRSLVPLFSKDDGQPKEKIRCFTSYKGRVALYLEAEPSSGFKDLKASFEYDLEVLAKGRSYDPTEVCRPCTSSEMVQLYCSADFAAKGSIISAEDDPYLRLTKITLVASKVFQQTTQIFSKDENKTFIDARREREYFGNSLEEDDHDLHGHVFLPIECQARAGEGEFVVLGSMKLGKPVLRCAPRFEEWKNVVRSAQDKAHCVLES